MTVRVSKRFREFKEQMLEAARFTTHRGGEIINAQAKDNLTEKGHVVTGTLRRSGWVKDEETRHSIRAIISFPVGYAEDVEELPDGGYLHPAIEEKTNEVYQYMQADLAEAIRSFR